MLSRCFSSVSFSRLLSLVLLAAFLFPMGFIGAKKEVSAQTFYPPPAIVMPEILTAPPEPFRFGSRESGVESYSFLSVLSVWDDLVSWFDSSANSPNSESQQENFNTESYQENSISNQARINVALASSGGTAAASSELTVFGFNFPAHGVNNGDRKGLFWGTTGGWSDSTQDTFPDWVQVNFSGAKLVDEINVFTLQDNYQNPIEPNEAMTFSQFGITAFDVQYWNGSGWVTVPNGSVANSNKVWSKFVFSPITTSSIRVVVNNALATYCRIVEVEAWGVASGANIPLPPASNLSRLRLSPKNATGGTNLYSRNFGWGTGLAGLSGRGLDAGFGISYNSLVWLKDGSNIVFNPNKDNVTPGFRFGFPVIEPQYLDSLTNKNTFLMVTPSGARVEFRQVDGSTDTFETPDSSYTQLKVLDANNLTITGTDGTQAKYELKAGMFRCVSIKDSNGNFITINHNSNGLLQSVTDTLGRVISISYDALNLPQTITQTRSTGTFTFASFTYSDLTLNTNFSGLNIVGAVNGTPIKVLQKITYTDGSFTQFAYNSFGQVWWVNNHAADGHKLNYLATNLDAVSGAQTDVPRFSQLRNWAENFNANQEVVTYVEYLENQTFQLPNSSQATGTKLRIKPPDGTISDTYVGNSGWLEALPIVSEDFVLENNSWVKKRWSWTDYTQDNPSLNYLLNPRVIESKVGDAANTKRTTMSYHTYPNNTAVAVWGLVKEVVQYDANGTTPLKKNQIEYNFDAPYTSRRLIGLPVDVRLVDPNDVILSRMTYVYDQGDFSGAGQNISPIQHDTANYGAGFVVGRGNLTSVTRWDINNAANPAQATVMSRIKYDTAGNPVSSLDPLNREVKTSYADSFDDNQNRNTFAYPTQITDPAGNSSTVKYRFDIGANVFAQSPAPQGQSVGKQTQRIYDGLGRLEKEIVLNTGAYTRYVYPANGFQSIVYSTVTDVNGNGTADTADEVYSDSFADGAGRTRVTRTEHPGSVGGWSVSITEYDVMGRVKRQSVPTEVNGDWQPSGDDATRGWLWNAQEYDWKGRVIRQINTDGTDKLFSYEGCGCAGGQVTTVSGEQLAEGRRRQKIYEDILGRTYKTEVLNWDGSVYSTTKTFFNGRDQVTTARQYAGTETSETYQDTIMT